jgi:hypothetical protein
MSAAKHRFLAMFALLVVGALMGATFAAGHPLDATDLDHDGFKNWADNCPDNYNPKQIDTDKDTQAPVVSEPQAHPSTGPVIVYPYTPALPQDPPAELPTDKPADAGGDSCDADDDGDGITDNPKRDNCALIPNPDQKDSDFDGRGDVCDKQNGTPDATGTVAAAAPDDGKAPAVAIATRTVIRYDEIGRGLAIWVRCDEACSLDGQLVVKKRAVARGTAQIGAKGGTWVFLKFAKKAKKQMLRKPRALATFKLTVKDLSGNRAVAQKRITLRP